MLYDFLVGGMLSAALVPVLSDYARLDRGGKRRCGRGRTCRLMGAKVGPNPELVRLVGALLSLAVVSLAGLALLMVVFAPQVAGLLAGGFDDFDPALLPLTARLVRLMAPVVWFISMAGLLTGVLFALQRFSVPALASAVYNLGIRCCRAASVWSRGHCQPGGRRASRKHGPVRIDGMGRASGRTEVHGEVESSGAWAESYGCICRSRPG